MLDVRCDARFHFPIAITGNDPKPSIFDLAPGGSQTVTVAPGVHLIDVIAQDLRIRFGGDCTGPGSTTSASFNMEAGGSKVCPIDIFKEALVIQVQCLQRCMEGQIFLNIQGIGA